METGNDAKNAANENDRIHSEPEPVRRFNSGARYRKPQRKPEAVVLNQHRQHFNYQ